MPTSIKIEKMNNEDVNWKGGIYQSVIKDIKDRILDEDTKYNQKGDKLLTFEFDILKEGEFKGKRVWKDWVKPYTSAPRKGKDGSTLYQIIKAIHPDWGDLEIYSLESINSLINKQVLLNIRTEEGSDGNTYPRISGYAPVDTELPWEPTVIDNSVDESEISLDETPF